ncbi:hypothetical protein PANT_20c00021 [Moesziomyces antarcticus T-34]|uniref:Uncharacterized protein n=1 Tax=Pseudozyma antarctica (strain T-34) TaxID=1151754 RepID=M9LS49_PSEA3|nr:hypothetical protein PANT_20c00021 [Moesziomyces antarcticus T-34]
MHPSQGRDEITAAEFGTAVQSRPARPARGQLKSGTPLVSRKERSAAAALTSPRAGLAGWAPRWCGGAQRKPAAVDTLPRDRSFKRRLRSRVPLDARSSPVAITLRGLAPTPPPPRPYRSAVDEARPSVRTVLRRFRANALNDPLVTDEDELRVLEQLPEFVDDHLLDSTLSRCFSAILRSARRRHRSSLSPHQRHSALSHRQNRFALSLNVTLRSPLDSAALRSSRRLISVALRSSRHPLALRRHRFALTRLSKASLCAPSSTASLCSGRSFSTASLCADPLDAIRPADTALSPHRSHSRSRRPTPVRTNRSALSRVYATLRSAFANAILRSRRSPSSEPFCTLAASTRFCARSRVRTYRSALSPPQRHPPLTPCRNHFALSPRQPRLALIPVDVILRPQLCACPSYPTFYRSVGSRFRHRELLASFSLDRADFRAAMDVARERSMPPGLSPQYIDHQRRAEARLRCHGECYLEEARREDESLPRTWDDFLASEAQLPDWFWGAVVHVLCVDHTGGPRTSHGVKSELRELFEAHNRLKKNAAISTQLRKSCDELVHTHPDIVPPHEKEYATWDNIEQLIRLGIFGECMSGIARWKPDKKGEPLHLSVDFKVRLMKGSRGDHLPSKKIPILSSNEAGPILDPVLLLAWMAIEDGAFQQRFSLEALTNVDASKLPKGTNTWELRMRRDVGEQPIFRRFKRTAGQAYEPDPARGLHEDDLHNRIKFIRVPAGLPTFKLYDVRRTCAQTLNNPLITPGDMLRAFEHRPGSTVLVDDYLLERVEIDVLALLRGQEQRKKLIAGRGVKKVPYVALTVEDEVQLVDKHEEVQRLLATQAEARDLVVKTYGSAARRPNNDPVYAKYIRAQSRTSEARLRVRNEIRAQRSDEQVANTERRLFESMATHDTSSGPRSDTHSPWQQRHELSFDAHSVERRQFLANLYREIKERLARHFDVPIDVDELFRSGSDRMSHGRFDEALRSGHITKTTKWTDKPCPCCGLAFEKMTHPLSHLRGCFTDTETSNLSGELFAQFKRQSACPFANCVSEFRTRRRRDYVQKHLATYHSLAGVSVQNRSCGCTFRSEGSSTDRACSFSVPDASAASVALMACHREQAHGLILDASDAVRFCDFHEEWLVGPTEIQRHFEKHLAGGDGAVPPQTCPWCFVDETLDPCARAKTMPSPGNLGAHINAIHIFRLRHVCPCPVCDTRHGSIGDLIRHIGEYHGRKLHAGGRRGGWSGDLNDLIVTNNSYRSLKDEFVKFWSENAPKTSVGCSRNDTSASREDLARGDEVRSSDSDGERVHMSERRAGKRRALTDDESDGDVGRDYCCDENPVHMSERRAGKQRALTEDASQSRIGRDRCCDDDDEDDDKSVLAHLLEDGAMKRSDRIGECSKVGALQTDDSRRRRTIHGVDIRHPIVVSDSDHEHDIDVEVRIFSTRAAQKRLRVSP